MEPVHASETLRVSMLAPLGVKPRLVQTLVGVTIVLSVVQITTGTVMVLRLAMDMQLQEHQITAPTDITVWAVFISNNPTTNMVFIL